MQSVLLLGAVGALIAAPGIAAALLAYKPDGVGIVTRCAAVFGVGFAVAGGCAFVLAAAGVLWLYTYLPLWALVTGVLWIVSVRTVNFRAQGSAIWTEIKQHPIPLVLGAAVLLAMLIIRLTYLRDLPGAHFVYILNGIEIANDHGVPHRVLEYGQAWAPATDKVFLDAFTAALVMIHNNPLLIPGVLLWVSFAGAAIGAWALVWELGLRWTGVLLPVLLLGDRALILQGVAKPLQPGTQMTAGFEFYRAENFGIAISFCALALALSAIRKGGWPRIVMAAVALAAASGTHLVPLVIVLIVFACVVLAELVRRGRERARVATFRDAVLVCGTGGVLGLLLRLFAGGSFGLGGATNQSSYRVLGTRFDATAYLHSGLFLSAHPRKVDHFYVSPGSILKTMATLATGLHSPALGLSIAVFAAAALIAIAFAFFRTELAGAAFGGAGTLIALPLIAMIFSFRYDVWVDGTFGIRRLVLYLTVGSFLLVLTLIEAALALIREREWELNGPLATAAAVAVTVVICLVLLPSTTPLQTTKVVTKRQQQFASFVRQHTPCGARFLLDERSEGAVAALTGRYALDEGMGPFLRPSKLPHVVKIAQQANGFFEHPQQHEAFLREHDIDYVVWSWRNLLGYPGPISLGRLSELDRTPFLKQLIHLRGLTIYHVEGSRLRPVSPLLKGPYLGCRTGAANY